MGNETPTNGAPVTVEQCDREAFARLDDWEPGSMGWNMIVHPTGPDCVGVVAFAKHRLAALASAPAGDAVTVIRRHADEARQAAETDADRPQRAEQHRIFAHALDELAREVAALARPRAAVGEQSRELVARRLARTQIYADRDEYESNNMTFDQWVDQNWRDFLDDADDLLLALQSPPAKVEG